MARRASRLPRRSAIVVRRDRRMAQGRCKFVEARFVEAHQRAFHGSVASDEKDRGYRLRIIDAGDLQARIELDGKDNPHLADELTGGRLVILRNADHAGAQFVEIRQGKLTGGAIGLKKYDQRRPARSEPGNRRSGLRRGDHKSDNKFSTRGKVKTKNLETRRERRKNPEDSGVVTRGENCRDTERLFL